MTSVHEGLSAHHELLDLSVGERLTADVREQASLHCGEPTWDSEVVDGRQVASNWIVVSDLEAVTVIMWHSLLEGAVALRVLSW
jgi:hypothetical protein